MEYLLIQNVYPKLTRSNLLEILPKPNQTHPDLTKSNQRLDQIPLLLWGVETSLWEVLIRGRVTSCCAATPIGGWILPSGKYL